MEQQKEDNLNSENLTTEPKTTTITEFEHESETQAAKTVKGDIDVKGDEQVHAPVAVPAPSPPPAPAPAPAPAPTLTAAPAVPIQTLKTECEDVNVSKPVAAAATSAGLNVTNGSLFDDSDEFAWDEYLLKTNARSAPPECFCQNDTPPVNQFTKGHKLETYDPRNTSSTCIATVIETHGPRLRLRLDGTDDRNDFWLMCDSELIHPYGYSEKLGRKIQPPLGFGKELSTWPKFLEKLVQLANDKHSFAGESCFGPAPRKPVKNEFKEGDKLEAVDPKNPHLICPATVREIKREKLFISFDGWSQSSQFWVTFTSRDLFPCGWCSRAGHILQYPGNLEEKPHPVKQRTSSVNNNNVTINNSTTRLGTSLSTTTTKSKPKVNGKRRIGSEANKNNRSIENRSLSSSVSSQSSLSNNSALNLTYDTTTIDNNNNSNVAKPTTTNNNSISLNKSTSAVKSKLELTSGEEKLDTASRRNSQAKENVKSSTSMTNGIDLSMIKSEPTEYGVENGPNMNDSTNSPANNTNNKPALNGGIASALNGSIQSSSPNSSINNSNKISNAIIVWVNPNCDCGKYVISHKFHKSHTKFGPGLVHSVYKSILQSFVDCANNRQEVFKMIPSGKSNEYVRLKTTLLKEKKNIRTVTNAKELWAELKSFCKLLGIDDTDLFSAKMFKKPKPVEKQTSAVNLIQPPLNNIENIHNATSTSTSTSQSSTNQAPRKTHSNIELSQPVSSDSAKSAANHQNERLNSTTNALVNSSHSEAPVVKSSTPVAQKRRHSPANQNNNQLQANSSTTAANHDQHNGSVQADLENSSLDHSNQVPPKINRLDLSQHNPITDWTIEQVVNYVNSLSDNYFASHLEMFRHHEIDGKALLLLTTDILMKYMGFKLGPALKLNNYLDKLRNQIKQQQQQQQQ